MQSISRIHSSDNQIFFNGDRVIGVTDFSIDHSRERRELDSLGRYDQQNSLLTSNQECNVTIGGYIVKGGFNPFNTSTLLYTTGETIKSSDTVESVTISGLALTSCDFNISLGEIPSLSASYQGDIASFDTGDVLTMSDQTTDGSEVILFRPQEMSLALASAEEDDLVESICFQSMALSIQIGRRKINRMGQRSTQLRLPELPAKGSFTFSVLKTNPTGYSSDPILLEKNDYILGFKNKSHAEYYRIKDLSLISIAEAKALDGEATLDFTFEFPLLQDSIILINGLPYIFPFNLQY